MIFFKNMANSTLADYFLTKSEEILKYYNVVADMDFYFSENSLTILRPSHAAKLYPARVSIESKVLIIKMVISRFLRFRVIDDPESCKLTIFISDISTQKTLLFNRDITSGASTKSEVSDGLFWFRLKEVERRIMANLPMKYSELRLLPCTCSFCGQCLWRKKITGQTLTSKDIEDYKKLLNVVKT
ncbi:MAG: hypothetical protein JNL74_07860 [Fibrobacteres bacterium]|nr:hypothetical protein [Fibrobacterota bacterium]